MKDWAQGGKGGGTKWGKARQDEKQRAAEVKKEGEVQ